MLSEVDRLQVTMDQMTGLLAALDDLKQNVLPKDPAMFAIMADGPLDDLSRLRADVERHSQALRAAG